MYVWSSHLLQSVQGLLLQQFCQDQHLLEGVFQGEEDLVRILDIDG